MTAEDYQEAVDDLLKKENNLKIQYLEVKKLRKLKEEELANFLRNSGD